MNAIVESQDSTSAFRSKGASISVSQRFLLLLKREFWEHRGGFLWAPLVTGAIAIVFSLFGAIAGSLMFDGRNMRVNDLSFNGAGGVEAVRHAVGFAGDIALLVGVGITTSVLVFVVFFYALGSLYDERKDRSVLFWKSLPVSDAETVLSKATWALLLAPALAVVIGLIVGVTLWLITAGMMLVNGIPGAEAVFSRSHPFRVIAHVLSAIPIYVLWALPTVGWLMLCSAWARSKPFLWAVLLPFLGAILISWMGGVTGLAVPYGSVWYTLVVRGLLSIAPGTWYFNHEASPQRLNGPTDLANAIDFSSTWQVLGTFDLWIGAAIGAAMIYAAIWLRRHRELAD